MIDFSYFVPAIVVMLRNKNICMYLTAHESRCRGGNGELRLGIRRAARPRNGLPESIVGNQSCSPSFLSSVANAISAKSMFHVFYSPRYLYFSCFA
jgi:hypothetical protein